LENQGTTRIKVANDQGIWGKLWVWQKASVACKRQNKKKYTI
jgi:hypothetical protein